MVASAPTIVQAIPRQGDVLREAVKTTMIAYLIQAHLSVQHRTREDTVRVMWPTAHAPLPIALHGGATIHQIELRFQAGDTARDIAPSNSRWNLTARFIFNTEYGDGTEGFNFYGQGAITTFDNLPIMIFDAHPHGLHRFGDTSYTGPVTEDHIQTLAACVNAAISLLGGC